MSLATHHNINEHFDEIDASIFSGDLLFDDDAVLEILVYMKRWERAIDNHREAMAEAAIEEEEAYDAEKKAEKEKAECDYSVYSESTGHTYYEKFNYSHIHPHYWEHPKTFQQKAEKLIEYWNVQETGRYRYTLEKMWWNGER